MELNLLIKAIEKTLTLIVDSREEKIKDRFESLKSLYYSEIAKPEKKQDHALLDSLHNRLLQFYRIYSSKLERQNSAHRP